MNRTPPKTTAGIERAGLVFLTAGPVLLLVAALVAGGDSAPWIMGGAVVLAVVLGMTLVVLAGRRQADESLARRAMEAVLETGADAVLVESPSGEVVYASEGLRRILPAAADAGPSLGELAALGEPLAAAIESMSTRNLADSRIVNLAGAGLFEISLSPAGDGGRLWRLRDISGKFGNLWADRAEAHGRLAAAGLYTLAADGRFLYVNPAMAEWIGRPVDEIVGANLRIRDVLAAEISDDPMRPGVGVIAIRGVGDRVQDLQVSNALIEEPDGPRLYGVARPTGPAGATAQRFKQLFQEMPVGVALVDQRLRIGDSNDTFHQLIGEHEAAGKPILDFVSDSDKVAIARELQAILAGESAAKSLEVRIKGASEAVASIFVGRLQDDLERTTGLVLLVIDNTEQKMLETQLAQSQKMQAVGQLAGGIAHDFNNVLTAMIGFCDLLLQRHRPGDQSFADIMQIKQNANRAAALVRQLLAFSRQQTLQPRLLNVTEVLAELSNLLRRLLGEKIEMAIIHGRDLGLIKGDQGQLEQVIINLAVNARDAMDGGGTLTIETANTVTSQPRQAHGELMPAGEYVRISVRDTGSGIPKENFARIFEPFFTTKEVGSGTGLGLSTVYGIIKQTGGFLFVDSPGPGQGTVFDIFLTRHQADPAASTGAVVDEISGDLTGGGTVLLVEDEDPVRLFSARALRNKGYKVVEAKTGEAALELLDGGPYDLLVTDMVMPRVDGAQVIREARKLLPDLPVICISGYTEESVLKEVESLDKLRFLSKPFSLKQLASAVKEAIEKNARKPDSGT